MAAPGETRTSSDAARARWTRWGDRYVRFHVLLVSLAVLNAACTPKGDSSIRGILFDTGEPDSGPTSLGCPAYTGLYSSDLSTGWHYDGQEYMATVRLLARRVVQADAATGAVEFAEHQAVVNDIGIWQYDYRVYATCDSVGYSVLGYDFESLYTGGYGDVDVAIDGSAGNITFDTPVLTVPAALAPGETWSSSHAGVITLSTGETYPNLDVRTSEVIGEEDVEIPTLGGTVPAMRIDETSNSGTLSYWYHETYGLVKVGALTLNEYDYGELDTGR